ncbi:MAG TPA: hypothetical protein VFQ56_06445, partial [Flavobacterium sp.]|nr:hypothetical protein [Flavobacterium sp.]
VMVEECVDYVLPLLSRIIETFPTYTLHDGQHQLNILNRMADLLGKRIKDLSGLESALLILSAFYHDIGMVFSKEELQNLVSEETFQEFLNENPKAKVDFLATSKLSTETAEWYCRWAHARRVWIYLNKTPNKFVWDGTNLKNVLGHICQSHNEDVAFLKDDYVFETNFWGQCDIRFCAIILRISDILDFDNTRSPESVYEFLKLDKPIGEAEAVSHKEWEKHLASRGFDFTSWSKSNSYDIGFKAAPKHPAVENDIKEFLDLIESELSKNQSLLRSCSKKWQTFYLPERILRNNIKSQGYKAGNYKFTLDQHQVLDLLMGDKLYNNEFVFIRELLQNAIDTSRDREFHEQQSGNVSFKIKPIEVSSWIDSSGFRWLRIDDYGMGMTEDIINKFFLKVGNSYYNSYDFQLRKMLYQSKLSKDFTPISRFGIGVLSCFIIGDRIEVNTKSVECINNRAKPIRLSLKGLHNFYVMQSPPDVPNDMPNENFSEDNYRTDYGTSIAVRFRADKDTTRFNLKVILEQILFNSDIDIILKN